jgi:hypothetical protein
MARANRSSVDRLGFAVPLSSRALVDCETTTDEIPRNCEPYPSDIDSMSERCARALGVDGAGSRCYFEIRQVLSRVWFNPPGVFGPKVEHAGVLLL